MKIKQSLWSPDHGWMPPLSSLDLADAQLVFLFGDATLANSDACIDPIERAFPCAHLFGCSGTAICSRASAGDTLVLTAVVFEHSRIATARVHLPSPAHSRAAAEELIRQLDPDGLRHIFVLTEGAEIEGSEVAAGLQAARPVGVAITGGLAAGGIAPDRTHLWCDAPPERSALVAVGFYGARLRLHTAVTDGWRPFGPDRLITKSSQNSIQHFDGRPALPLYQQYVTAYTDTLPSNSTAFPVLIRTGPDEERLYRTVIGTNERDQSITLSATFPQRDRARFMVGHSEDLIASAVAAAEACRDTHPGRPVRLGLLVSCTKHRAILKQRVDEEVTAVREALGESTVLAGFYSLGEIGSRRPGASVELHNQTMVITSLSEE